jgi:hypothetical protein
MMASAKIYSRLFTVEEANQLLPVVRRLVEEIFERIEQLRDHSRGVIRREGLDPNGADFMQGLQKDPGVARAIEEVNGLVDEIHALGCICKGIADGIVDFPCSLGKEIVFLCWRYGEEAVSHWHRVEDGFAGRRELLDALDRKDGGENSYH